MGLNDYRYALEFRAEIQRLVTEEVEKQRPRYQMATVTGIDRTLRRCTVRRPADTSDLTVSMGSIQPSSIGQLVRIEGLAGDRYISDVMGPAYEPLEEKANYTFRSQASVIGGGILTVSATYEVKWSERFVVISLGRDADIAANGYFEITVPSAGQVITGYGGASNKTVTANGIPLSTWDALWYELPFGSTSTSLPGNFRVINYVSNFVVPSNWVLLCVRNTDSTTIDWTTGAKLLAGASYYPPMAWTPLSTGFQNSWVNFGLSYTEASYRRNTEGRVFCQGLIKSGSTGTIFTFPQGFRPSSTHIFIVESSSNGVARVQIDSSGAMALNSYGTGGTNANVSLEQVAWDVNE